MCDGEHIYNPKPCKVRVSVKRNRATFDTRFPCQGPLLARRVPTWVSIRSLVQTEYIPSTGLLNDCKLTRELAINRTSCPDGS